MKIKMFIALTASVLMFSCFQETTKKSNFSETANIVSRNNQWKTAVISPETIDNQRAISHYEFDANGLQSLLESEGVNYVWFDLVLNSLNQITFTATGENKNIAVLGQVHSNIIAKIDYTEDFSIFNEIQDVPLEMEDPTVTNHILSNSDAFLYITSMREGYENFEDALDHDGQRVERFGIEAIVVKRMLQTNNIHSLALFLGKNNAHKMTTVFVGKDSYGNLLIDASSQYATSGRVYDVTTPCPPYPY